MKQTRILVGVAGLFLITASLIALKTCKPVGPTDGALRKVVINEAVRTILYLPLYHAKEKGFFAAEGVEADIVTGGTATNSFAAMLSGDADFSQADPMYVPISREKGSRTKVVAQVVARIAVWGLTKSPGIEAMTRESLLGKTVATQPRPMTAYTYTIKTINDVGLVPGKDVKIIETQSPNEIIPFLNGQADYAMTIEPNTSIAESQGARVILSYPKLLGDQIFTGLMTTEDYISTNPDVVQGVVNAYQRALRDLHENPQDGITTAKIYFPQLDDSVLQLAIKRLTEESVLPSDVGVPEESWVKAIKVRVDVGDLKRTIPRTEAVETSFADKARSRFP